MKVIQIILFRSDISEEVNPTKFIEVSQKAILKIYNIEKIETVKGGILEPHQELYRIETTFGKDSILYEWVFGNSDILIREVEPIKFEEIKKISEEKTLPVYYDEEGYLVLGPYIEEELLKLVD